MTRRPQPQPLERRRSRRVEGEAGKISVVGARLVNLSPIGMSIDSPLPMELHAVHQFRLVIAAVKGDVEARVVNCVAARTGKRRTYRIGLEFTHIPPEIRDRLDRLVGEHG